MFFDFLIFSTDPADRPNLKLKHLLTPDVIRMNNLTAFESWGRRVVALKELLRDFEPISQTLSKRNEFFLIILTGIIVGLTYKMAYRRSLRFKRFLLKKSNFLLLTIQNTITFKIAKQYYSFFSSCMLHFCLTFLSKMSNVKNKDFRFVKFLLKLPLLLLIVYAATFCLTYEFISSISKGIGRRIFFILYALLIYLLLLTCFNFLYLLFSPLFNAIFFPISYKTKRSRIYNINSALYWEFYNNE